MKVGFSHQIFENTLISNLLKIRLVGAELFHAVGRTEGHYEANSSFSPVTSSFLGPNILLNTMFSNTLSFLSSRSVNDQVSLPYKTTVEIIVLYILIFKFLDSNLEDKRFCTE